MPGTLVTYNGQYFPQGDPLVSVSKSPVKAGGNTTMLVASITLEGIYSVCGPADEWPGGSLEGMFSKDFKTLVVAGTTWNCCKVTSINFGGGDEFSFTPYSVTLEAYTDMDSFTADHGVTDVSKEINTSQDKDGIITKTVSASARGLRTCDGNSPFDHARAFVYSLVGQGQYSGGGAGGGNTNVPSPISPEGDAGAPMSTTNTTNSMLMSTEETFDRIAATFSITETYRIGSPVSTTTTVSKELGKTTTSIQGSIVAAGGVDEALALYQSVKGGSSRVLNENITQDHLWGGITFSYSVETNDEPRVLLDISTSLSEGEGSSLISVSVTVAAVVNAPDVEFDELEGAVNGASAWAEALEVWDLYWLGVADKSGRRILQGEALSISTSSSPKAMQYSKTYNYNNRGQKYSGGTQGTSSFTAEGAVVAIAEQATAGGFVYTDLGYHTLGQFNASASANCGAHFAGTSMFSDYVTVGKASATSQNTSSTTSAAQINSFNGQYKYEAKQKVVTVGAPTTINTLKLED